MDSARFLSATVAIGLAACAFLLHQLSRRIRDRFLGSLAAVFLLLAVVQGLSALLSMPPEQVWWIYVGRLIAFVMLIGAILRTNLAR